MTLIAQCAPTVMDLPSGQRVAVTTQRWLPPWWAGEPEPAGVPRIWARKPMVAVAGRPCCAELAVVAELGAAGWQGAWVSAFGGFVRRQWFPGPAFRTMAAAGAAPWAAEIFDAVKDANGGTLAGFFDVFAWREPAEVLFCEVKVGPDRIQASQRQFLAHALRLRPLSEFMVIEMPRPARKAVARRPAQPTQAVKERPVSAACRAAAWTSEEVLDAIAHAGQDAAAVAVTVCDWASARPYIRVTGGTGVSYPSLTVSADTARSRSRYCSVLSLYASPQGGPATLEIRATQMCRTPPFHRHENQARFLADMHSLGIPRLDAEPDLATKRPNIPLEELTDGRAEDLLSLIERWISDVQRYATEPEPSDGA